MHAIIRSRSGIFASSRRRGLCPSMRRVPRPGRARTARECWSLLSVAKARFSFSCAAINRAPRLAGLVLQPHSGLHGLGRSDQRRITGRPDRATRIRSWPRASIMTRLPATPNHGEPCQLDQSPAMAPSPATECNARREPANDLPKARLAGWFDSSSTSAVQRDKRSKTQRIGIETCPLVHRKSVRQRFVRRHGRCRGVLARN